MTSETALQVAPAVCAHCLGSGFEDVEGKGVRPCRCQKTKRIRDYFDRARIPARYTAASLENYQTLCPAFHRALQVCRRYIEAPEGGLLFMGTCGTGKTHLAVAVLRAMIERGRGGLFYDFRDLLAAIKASYNPETHDSELTILQPVICADLLVLDELGASKPTEWVQETMTYIVNERYNENRITIFTANYSDAGDETLTDRVGARLRSRLFEMCRPVEIEGPDMRQLIARSRAGAQVSM
jgi:DNA replication protein DnaC